MFELQCIRIDSDVEKKKSVADDRAKKKKIIVGNQIDWVPKLIHVYQQCTCVGKRWYNDVKKFTGCGKNEFFFSAIATGKLCLPLIHGERMEIEKEKEKKKIVS